MEPLILRILLLAVGLWVVLTGLAFLLADRVLFQPPPPSYDRKGLDFVRVPVDDDGAVAVQHRPNPGADFTILLSHGNAEDLGHLQPLITRIHAAGFAVIAYDYRGYGQSSGPRPSEARAVEDAEAVYRYATRDLGVEPGRLIVHGRSLGGGPTLVLAERYPVGGVVLESTFTSAYRVVTGIPILAFDRFRNLDRLAGMEAPLLVMHGTRDLVIGARHGRVLFAAAPEPKRALWVEGAGHNDLAMVAGERYGEALRRLAEDVTHARARR